jgi:hypothetical protein
MMVTFYVTIIPSMSSNDHAAIRDSENSIEAEEAGFRFSAECYISSFARKLCMYISEYETAKLNNGIVVALL